MSKTFNEQLEEIQNSEFTQIQLGSTFILLRYHPKQSWPSFLDTSLIQLAKTQGIQSSCAQNHSDFLSSNKYPWDYVRYEVTEDDRLTKVEARNDIASWSKSHENYSCPSNSI